MLPVADLFLPERCLHDAQDLFRIAILQRPRCPLFLQAELGRFRDHMKMHMHHFLSRTSTIVLNDVALLDSGRGTRGAGDAGQHPANSCG